MMSRGEKQIENPRDKKFWKDAERSDWTGRGYHQSYHEYTPLNASREHTLEEYANIELCDKGVEQTMKITK